MLSTRTAALLLLALASTASAQARTSSRTVLQTTTTTTGQPLAFPARGAKVTATLNTLKTKGQTGAMMAQVPMVVHVLSGTVSVEVAGKAPRTIATGSAFVAPLGTAMNLVNRGNVPSRYVAVSFGAEGRPVALAGAGAPRDSKADTVLDVTTTWAGEAILFPADANQVSVLLTTVPAGAVIAKHTHAHTQFVYMLEGEHTVEPTGHAKHSFSAGSAMIETTQPHTGTNAGAGADRFVTVFVGKAGVPLSTPVH